MSRFQLAVASGKGGTGKTSLAVALALALESVSGEAGGTLLDTDVEAPNAHLFLPPANRSVVPVTRLVPVIDTDLCTVCGICREACEFNALAQLGGPPLLFPELCAGCGACVRLCPADAMAESRHEVGVVEQGVHGPLRLVHGRLKVGEARAVPLVDAVRRQAGASGWVIIDAPPGTACPAVAAVRGVDYLILVTEPTPFGLNDLKLAVAMARELGLPHGVVINRADVGDDGVAAYCAQESIDVLLTIPFDPEFARAGAAGGTLLDVRPELAGELRQLVARLRREVAA